MGSILAKLNEALQEALSSFTNNGVPTRVLMLGLDAAGKTTILYKVCMCIIRLSSYSLMK